MGRVPDSVSLKRKRPEGRLPALTDAERALFEVIESKTTMGIWLRDLKHEVKPKLSDPMVNKSLKSLQLKQLIKEVVNIQNKSKKTYMAVQFEPSTELTGGAWYANGQIDEDFIKFLKQRSMMHVRKSKVATVEQILESINSSGVVKEKCTIQQVTEIMRLLVFANEAMEVKSTGMGDYMKIPVGKLCYRSVKNVEDSHISAMASIPCGVCPRISECTPDGIISPSTCVYYNKWLDF